jgi:SNF2 family DNA or RNA helicase
VVGASREVAALKDLLALKPGKPLGTLKGMKSSLRDYQKIGVDWLSFLFENRLGGLLCDDMGLGKTHQVMALMVKLREKEKIRKPLLVVCPTTVLSHWSQKISVHAPALKAAVFHGGERDLEGALKDHNILLTSYGILRNDIEELKRIPFSLAVFDEIQNIKNPQTLAYEAARNIKATMKLGLTGTPIENTLSELKALFDLTVPGYLGPDEDFSARYVKPIEMDLSSEKRQVLSRLISPFTLRRLKKTVLDELPEKIEDIRTCGLSDDQIKLYRDALSSRGIGLVDVLKKGEEPIPYIHIFALLSLLKQICDHPALLEGRMDDFDRYPSGKWELFKELLSESLDSGQKVVVYSQFLGMIGIMERYLRELDVDFVTLTGASRKRGEIVARFNENPDCRVYVGSLKAGGTGIDLVAASVVIHYDRWWNAAKEDQATDRVHRIGQRRGVQVFKLVTEGTLEEKISAIIEKKRNLMDSIVTEDDPGLLKTFSREDLIEMLSNPSEGK